MRVSALSLLALLPMAPVAAQFEGTVAMKLSAPEMGNESIAARYHIKGKQFAMAMAMPASAGPMAGQEVRMIFNTAAQKMTVLMPVVGEMAAMMGGAKGVKMEVDLEDVATGGATAPGGSIRKLGTSQRVAGRGCDDYEMTTEGETFRMCLAEGLGNFMMPSGGGMGRPASVPAWARNLEGKFPLKVSDKGGRGVLEVTSITEGTVPASVFVIPADYQDMSGMMGGMGGMGGTRRNN